MTAKADTRLRRIPDKGSKDEQLARDIIDEARICHVGFTVDEQPYVVPMAIARDGDRILLHGSVVSRLITNLAGGLPCCVTVTHLDGLVYARSAFNSSMNYRSLMVFGSAEIIADPEEKERGLDILVEHLLPGRLSELRKSTRKELNATTLLSLPLATFSIKVGEGPPDDTKSDVDTPIWAGVVPLKMQQGEPQAAPDMVSGTPLPAYLRKSD
ncbi:MAG: pyridoxamine 5'-phosphate oxidase family protein [Xanthomonadales bacterium]|nr:pyridoxamine 5'-phosphate oxidase family protein [Gammaproteobacteria bacterium]NND56505.1 pyridoxamine 5'-phosphate oxidase family protein [Xanthomonadales bacterium]NNK52507.1 pyridoxamine 5'-phosphate oxidase family protein [Xanthomonadales bacterium]